MRQTLTNMQMAHGTGIRTALPFPYKGKVLVAFQGYLLRIPLLASGIVAIDPECQTYLLTEMF